MIFKCPGNMIIVCILLLAAAGTRAQDANDEAIDEITVVGEKTLLNLRYAAQQAEDDFFTLFNELNDNDEFDVYCDKESNTYSRVKRRRCWSPFERDVDSEELRYQLETGGRLGMRNDGMIRAKRKEQAELLKRMVLENPALQDLYRRYGEANHRFYGERERRCSDNILCRDPDNEDTPQ
ncbi:MAG: hypothetical protein P8X94_14170 [Woeseiaceae bacterium]